MEWKDLSGASKCVLERCWGITDDNPRCYSVPLGKVLYGYKVTIETFLEIMKYQKFFPYFNAKLENDAITVSGIGQFGSWKESD
jgi:hypothetical protein